MIKIREELPEFPIGSYAHVVDAWRIRTEAVTNRVIGRKTEGQQVNRIALAQFFLPHSLFSELFQKLVSERAGVNSRRELSPELCRHFEKPVR